MRLRVATLLITGLLFSSALAREAPRALTLPEVVKRRMTSQDHSVETRTLLNRG